MKIAIGCDHGGYDLKEVLKPLLAERGIDVVDVGTNEKTSVDYPDYAGKVSRLVSAKDVDQGVVICTTGIGVSIAANKFPGVRAALCTSSKQAEMARRHNNANVLALGGENSGFEEASDILRSWLDSEFDGGRHKRRVDKLEVSSNFLINLNILEKGDQAVAEILKNEHRQNRNFLNLIASENISSPSVMASLGSQFGDRYACGYPGARHYPGCANVDEVERLAVDRILALFEAEHANVQSYSGSSANMAVMLTALNPGDSVLSMSPDTGGHVTHGGKLNFSGKFYDIHHYRMDLDTGMIDYDQVAELADRHKPKLICIGDSIYSRFIDFRKFREIADANGAYLLADIAHCAGLVAADCYPNPVPYCDFVTLTTHKTMRGPRGGAILCQQRFAADIDRNVYPGCQGGPLMNSIAAKAVAFFEASQPEFKEYQRRVVMNAKKIAEHLEDTGVQVLSGGTDTHMLMADISKYADEYNEIESDFEKAGILLNIIPVRISSDATPIPMIRVGSSWLTSRGIDGDEVNRVAELIISALRSLGNPKSLAEVRAKVSDFMSMYPARQ